MVLNYKNKKSETDIINIKIKNDLQSVICFGSGDNKLIEGDNFRVMKILLDKFNMNKKIDLVYIDPPFATNNIFKYNEDKTATISSSVEDKIAYIDDLRGEKYIEFLRERLILIRELMANHASIYLHIDYKIGHYVKIIMDEIFGVKNFRNDITRIKCNPKNFKRKGYGNIKDMILFYTKSNDYIWNEPLIPFSDEEIINLYKKKKQNGVRYTTVPLHAPGETKNGESGQAWNDLKPPKGRHWRYDKETLNKLQAQGLIEWSSSGNPRRIVFAAEAKEKGKRVQDIWEYKDYQYPNYPTEKNIDLLMFILKTSSNEGCLVLDAFCGASTTLLACQKLKRNWIGIDNSQVAIKKSIEKINNSRNLYIENNYTYMKLS